jgi:APA family basic amino acid/polyamine antiporter
MTLSGRETNRESEPGLKRSLGLYLLTFYGLGNILGAGIYVLIGKVAGSAGILVPIAFIISALIVAVTAFSYAEFSARLPFSGGEAIYIQHGFGQRPLSVLVGVLLVLSGVISASAISRGFVGYLNVFLEMPGTLAIVLMVSSLCLVAIWGISQAVFFAALLTLLEIAGLVLIISVSGLPIEVIGARLPELIPSASWVEWQGIFLGAFLAFYAYIGFEDMVNVAEEVRTPQRTMPLAILLALVISTILYVLVAISAVLQVEPGALASSEAPLALIYSTASGSNPWLISLIGIVAIINGALIQIIMSSRVLYGMSRQQWLPALFGKVNSRTRTPVNATIFVSMLILMLALIFPIENLARTTSFIVLVLFVLVNMALVKLKITAPAPPGVKIYPIWVPVVGALLCAALIIFQVLHFVL